VIRSLLGNISKTTAAPVWGQEFQTDTAGSCTRQGGKPLFLLKDYAKVVPGKPKTQLIDFKATIF
jgi:hypothetical protein